MTTTKTTVYKGITITIKSNGITHYITLSVCDAVRHKIGTYEQALQKGLKWAELFR